MVAGFVSLAPGEGVAGPFRTRGQLSHLEPLDAALADELLLMPWLGGIEKSALYRDAPLACER